MMSDYRTDWAPTLHYTRTVRPATGGYQTWAVWGPLDSVWEVVSAIGRDGHTIDTYLSISYGRSQVDFQPRFANGYGDSGLGWRYEFPCTRDFAGPPPSDYSGTELCVYFVAKRDAVISRVISGPVKLTKIVIEADPRAWVCDFLLGEGRAEPWALQDEPFAAVADRLHARGFANQTVPSRCR